MADGAGDMPAPARRFERWLDRLLGGLAALILFAMMALTAVDVVGRYIFDAPVPGGFEITELMMASLIFAGLPLVTMRSEHVTIDMLDFLIPATVRRWQVGFLNLIFGLSFGVISWRLWLKAAQTVNYGDVTATLQIPMAPFVFFMALLTGLTALVLLFKVVWPGPESGGGNI